ncbi:MAG: hypothetical protein Q8M83_06670 [bacterium]|nr:hypothetical protein [bacterium]
MKKFTMLLVVILAAACGGNYELEENNQPADTLTCGFGTHQQDAECVAVTNTVPETPSQNVEIGIISTANPLACGQGTKQVDNECLPLVEGVPCEGENDPGNGTACVTTQCQNQNSCETVPGALSCGEGFYLCSPATATEVNQPTVEPKMCQSICNRHWTFLQEQTNPPLAETETTILSSSYTCEPATNLFHVEGGVLISALPHSHIQMKGNLLLRGDRGQVITLSKQWWISIDGNGRYATGDTGPSNRTPTFEMWGLVEEDGSFVFQTPFLMSFWNNGDIPLRAFNFSLKLAIVGPYISSGASSGAKPLSLGEIKELGVKTITLGFNDVVLYSGETPIKSTFVQSCEPLTMEVK